MGRMDVDTSRKKPWDRQGGEEFSVGVERTTTTACLADFSGLDGEKFVLQHERKRGEWMSFKRS